MSLNPETTRFKAWAAINADGVPIAASVRNAPDLVPLADGESLTMISIELPPAVKPQWRLVSIGEVRVLQEQPDA